MHRNAPTVPPPGQCYVCKRHDVPNWVDDERNLCGDCVCTHVLCDSCGSACGPYEKFKTLPGFGHWTRVLCATCLIKGLGL